jgi:hypothetical protein
MSRKLIVLAIFLLYISGFFFHAIHTGKTVYGDGIYYFSWLHSAVINHDFNFRNEFQHFGVYPLPTGNGMVANKYAVGPAILWSPAYIMLNNVIGGNGYELPYQLIIGLESLFYVFTGFILLNRMLTKLFGSRNSFWAISLLALATNIFFYGALDPVNSHGLSFFAATVFLTFLFEKQTNFLALGVSLGLLGLIRSQDILYGILIIPLIKNFRLNNFIKLFLGFFITVIPQLLAWQILYRTILISPYIIGGEYFTLTHPHVLEVLFSPQNGLILWTPAVLVGIIGLIIGKNSRIQTFRLVFLLLVLAEIFVVSTWVIWWQGASYSGRMFVSILPVVAFGMANLFSKFKEVRFNQLIINWAIIIPLGIINLLLSVYFLTMH